jgi:Xaa-Pro aminopeptidase
MEQFKHDFEGVRLCLNHSQSRIERGLCDLEAEFRQWQAKSNSQSMRAKLVEDLENFRWLLDQHFTRVAGEGYLERAVHQEPTLYCELRDIECWQARLVDHLDQIIDQVRHFDGERDSVRELAADFVALHDDILREESEERHLLERGFA